MMDWTCKKEGFFEILNGMPPTGYKEKKNAGFKLVNNNFTSPKNLLSMSNHFEVDISRNLLVSYAVMTKLLEMMLLSYT